MHRLTLAVFGLAVLILPFEGEASGKPLFPNPQFTTLQPLSGVGEDFDGDGRADLAITTKTNMVVVFHGQGDGTFSGQMSLGLGGPGLVTGDFNGDGFTDLATTAANMFPGHGDGTFGASIQSAVSGLRDIAAGDINGDGLTDLMAIDASGFRVLLGTASGVFLPQPYVATTTDPRVAALGDFDADGLLDLAIAWRDTFFNTYRIRMMRGLGTGAFTLSTEFTNPAQVTRLAAGDLDGDGRADVVATIAAAQPVLVYYSDPAGFSPSGPYPGAIGWVSIADLDGDGRNDIVSSTYGILKTLTHTAARAFGVLQSQQISGDNHALADFDADGRLDLLVTVEKTVYFGGSSGTFAIPRIPVNGLPYGIATGDIDGDGRPDIVVADQFQSTNSVDVFLGLGQGRFGPLTPVAAHLAAQRVAVCDIDGDGFQDVAATIGGVFQEYFSFYYGNGGGALPPSVDLGTTGSYPLAGACGDLNHDGRDDLVVAEIDAGAASVILGRGDRAVGPEIRYSVMANPRTTALGDFNEDGESDLIVGGGGGLAYRAGSAAGTFGAQVTIETAPVVWSIAVADLDRDGHLDLAISGQGELAVLYGHGDGTFTPRQAIDSGSMFTSVVVADLDRDDWPDLFAAISNGTGGFNDGEFYGSFRHNNHNRTFGAASRYALGHDTLQLAAADFNADGFPDIAAATFFGVMVLMNQIAVDSDGDGVLDSADCAPANPGAFAVPAEVSGLVCAGDDISWSSQAGSAGVATVYDVVRGFLPMNGAPPSQCLADGSASATMADPSVPAAGGFYWYQVRASNVCGVGTYGKASNGTPRVLDACP